MENPRVHLILTPLGNEYACQLQLNGFKQVFILIHQNYCHRHQQQKRLMAMTHLLPALLTTCCHLMAASETTKGRGNLSLSAKLPGMDGQRGPSSLHGCKPSGGCTRATTSHRPSVCTGPRPGLGSLSACSVGLLVLCRCSLNMSSVRGGDLVSCLPLHPGAWPAAWYL